jgi:dethiobiotin synthetase
VSSADNKRHPLVRGGAWFVTGTDTEVGKTLISASLLWALAQTGRRCIGMKPVASGCRETAAGTRCSDAEILLAHSSVSASYADVNPYRFEAAVAPHLAARAISQPIKLDVIRMHFERLCAAADWLLVEGVGGWLVPLNDDSTVSDLARLLGLPVLLVVGMRLGCLNYALLTAAAIERTGLELAGWVANQIDPTMALFDENVETLKMRINAPFLGAVPHLPRATPGAAAISLNLEPLTSRR